MGTEKHLNVATFDSKNSIRVNIIPRRGSALPNGDQKRQPEAAIETAIEAAIETAKNKVGGFRVTGSRWTKLANSQLATQMLTVAGPGKQVD